MVCLCAPSLVPCPPRPRSSSTFPRHLLLCPRSDGARMLLTPESSVLAQKQLGADIIVPLDELPPYHTEPQVLAASLARSHRWMARRWG